MALGYQTVRKLTLADDGDVIISFSYHPATVEAVKRIPHRRFDPLLKHWTVELTEETGGPFIRFCKNNGFDIPAEIAELALPFAVDEEVKELERVGQIRTNIEASKAFDADIEIPEALTGQLRGYQKAGLAHAQKYMRTINGDDMGLGKTIQAIAAIEAVGAYPALIITPASVKYNWEIQLNKWLPERSVSVIDVTRKQLNLNADIIIVNYTVLQRLLPILQGVRWGGLVCDEFHSLKNKKSQRTQAVLKLSKKIEFILLLSGTSVVNRPIELVAPLEILGRLDKDFGGYWHFAKKYCGAYRTNFGLDTSGATNIEELHLKLRSTCYIRRSKREVAKELPPNERTVLTIHLDPVNRREYDAAEANIIAFLREAALNDAVFKESLKGLSPEQKRVAREQRAWDAENKAAAAEHLVRISKLKKIAAEGKLASATEWIEDFLLTGQKLIVFASHTHIIEALGQHFKAPMYTGKVGADKRQAMIERFVQDDNQNLLILNTKAGGTGVDGLQAVCSTSLTLELDWTSAAHDQAEARLDRIGQSRPVSSYYMLAANTIDGDVYDIIEAKRKVINAINAGEFAENDLSIVASLIDRLLSK